MKTEVLKTGFEFGAVEEIPEGVDSVYIVGNYSNFFFPLQMLPMYDQIDHVFFSNGRLFLEKDKCREYCLYLIDKHNDSNAE